MSRPDEWTLYHVAVMAIFNTVFKEENLKVLEPSGGYREIDEHDLLSACIPNEAQFKRVVEKVSLATGVPVEWIADGHHNLLEGIVNTIVDFQQKATDRHWKEHIETMPQST